MFSNSFRKSATSFRPSLREWLIIILLTLGVCFPVFMASAQDEEVTLISPEQMAESLNKALANYRAELADLKSQLGSFEDARNNIQSEIDAYVAQNTAHSQLLLEPQPHVEKLENAIKNNRLAFRAMEEHVESLNNRLDSISILLRQTAERIDLARKQLGDIQNSRLSDTWKHRLESSTQSAIQVLSEKRLIGEKLLKILGILSDKMKVAMEAKKTIGEKLAARLEIEKKASIFKRFAASRNLNAKAFRDEQRFFRNRIESFFQVSTWKIRWMEIKLGGFDRWAVFFTILALIFAFQGRCRSILRRAEKRMEGTRYRYRRLALTLLHHSLLYIVLAVFLAFYGSSRFALLDVVLARALCAICLVFMTTRWGLVYLQHGFPSQSTALRSFVFLHLKRFLRFYRATFVFIIVLASIAGRDSLTMWAARGLLSAVFLGWTVVFWQGRKRLLGDSSNAGQALPNPKRIASVKGWTYLVAGGTFLFNIIGYRILAGLWFLAWNQTVAFLFWGWVGLNVVREWKDGLREEKEMGSEDALTSEFQVRWSLIQLLRVFCIFVPTVGIIQAWDPSGILREHIIRFFNFTVTIGNLHVSFKGVFLAAVILLITGFSVRIGRTLLKEKVLDKHSFERGLEDSILTITSYLGWGLGLILALGILGVNATSVAVVFGALSIGIGFGLQTIFNNFISGLILLFERPIQVGDILEIDGLRAKVKKINVRATVVQTFANASVIIPNSELVSKRVTNWSFKDKRMRREIQIGVAYESDIDLAQNTLLEIAGDIRDVLKYPKPDVIFVDHAESALIFRLRVWVAVNHYWTVPSQIRNEINRRFHELGIEIAFPQRDLHIRTLPKEIDSSALTGDSNAVQPGWDSVKTVST